MKKRIAVVIALFFLLFPAARLLAQDGGGAGGTGGGDTAKAKGDDEDLFPSVTLEIEDLSIEKIEAGLPDSEPLMAFERRAPLPGPGEISVAEPAVDTLLPQANGTAAPAGTSFFTSVLFGAGLQSNLLGRINLYRLGLSPVINLLFDYENADGYDYRRVGLGYGERRDEFAGGIKLASDRLSFAAEGGFRERERGLQEQTPYFSASDRFSRLSLDFSARAGDLFTFAAAADGAVTSFSVTGAAAPPYPADYPPTEYLAGGKVSGDLAWPAVRTGLSLAYRFRTIPGGGFETHRFRADLDARWDPLDALRAEASVGVFTSTGVPYLFPWFARVRWFVFDRLSLTLGGGYRVRERNLADVRDEFAFSDFPGSLPDNHGWYGEAGTQASFANLLLLTVDAVLAENSDYARLASSPDPLTGLYPVAYDSHVPTLSVDGRLKLPIAGWLTLSSVNRLVLPFASGNAPTVSLGGEAAADETTGAFGAKLSVRFSTDPLGRWEFPSLDASAYVRIVDNMKLTVEALDLLQPLIGGPRYALYPYLAPGIRARFKIEITL
ncbi:MAG: hypothetical protein JXD23_11900 [Spirochaetales bacterium]|nr:hypothetical protein [Spirochaetales bacterium]